MKENRKKHNSRQLLWRVFFVIGLFLVSVWNIVPYIEIPEGEIPLNQLLTDNRLALIKKITIYEGEHAVISYHDGNVVEVFMPSDTNILDVLDIDNVDNTTLKLEISDNSYNAHLLFLTIVTLLPCTGVSLFWLVLALIK